MKMYTLYLQRTAVPFPNIVYGGSVYLWTAIRDTGGGRYRARHFPDDGHSWRNELAALLEAAPTWITFATGDALSAVRIRTDEGGDILGYSWHDDEGAQQWEYDDAPLPEVLTSLFKHLNLHVEVVEVQP
jgi:hypothetical protein